MARDYDIRAIPLYTQEHTWLRDMGNGTVKAGITDYAQEQLGIILFVELPQPGTEVEQFQVFGNIESSKSVSELFSPVSGIVKEINRKLKDDPEMVNKDPYDAGWLITIEPSNMAEEMLNLLNADAYRKLLQKLDAE